MGNPYALAECTSMQCPRDADLDAPVSLPKSAMLCDIRGNYWCQQCATRCDLINWAHAQRYPACRVEAPGQTYAVSGGYYHWFTLVAFGSLDVIESLRARFLSDGDAPTKIA